MSEHKENTPEAAQNAAEGQLVVFTLGEEEFGVDIHQVKEIVRMPELTAVPKSLDYVAGICNLRGKVLPALDSRNRFGLKRREVTEDSRLLVVETDGNATGLIVDGLREVMHIRDEQIAPPPDVCKGIDRGFLSGVVKKDDGKRLVLILKLAEVLKIEDEGAAAPQDAVGRAGTGTPESEAVREEVVDDEQLVSFHIADEEYAFNIDSVREILRVSEITEVPNVPAYIKGVITVREQLIPIIDLRLLLGIDELIAGNISELEKIIQEHRQWVVDLEQSLAGDEQFFGALDPAQCAFGRWLAANPALTENELFRELRPRHIVFHELGHELLDMAAADKETALSRFKAELIPLEKEIIESLERLKVDVDAVIKNNQRIMVVENGTLLMGFLVDSVKEVLRLPKALIDAPPWNVSSGHREVAGVAKIDDGRRLIMIMDEKNLIGEKESVMLDEIKRKKEQGNSEQSQTLAEQSLVEEQLVTFFIGEEEYGVKIMQVQEINRLEDITSVPKAPEFIDGVTNLRGNVIPVMNIRKLFGREEREKDDRTRIVIVDIAGKKTGLKVDRVNEVLRIPKSDIDDTPPIVAGSDAARFMEGVCKLDGGRRMVMLINVQQILGADELETFNRMDGRKTSPERAEKAAVKAKKTPGRKKMKIAE
ncbi:chemotaxis protein CheW [Desulfobacterota bacterium M19]